MLQIMAKSAKLFKTGGVMTIDEIENGLHISLVKFIIELYSDSAINSKQAQLFISTHNSTVANLLDTSNVFVYDWEQNKFHSIKDDKAFSRTEDAPSMLKTKNYYNDNY